VSEKAIREVSIVALDKWVSENVDIDALFRDNDHQVTLRIDEHSKNSSNTVISSINSIISIAGFRNIFIMGVLEVNILPGQIIFKLSENREYIFAKKPVCNNYIVKIECQIDPGVTTHRQVERTVTKGIQQSLKEVGATGVTVEFSKDN